MAAGTGRKEEDEDLSPERPRDGQSRDSQSRSPGCRNTMTATRAEPRPNICSGIDNAYRQAVAELLEIFGKICIRPVTELLNLLVDTLRSFSCDDNLPAVIVGGLGCYISLRFGNCRKRRGSTMPWDIPPNMAVLWGVCWMFGGQDESYNYDTSWEDGHPYTGQQNTLPAGSWNTLPPAASPLALGDNILLLGWDGLIDYSTPVLSQHLDTWPLSEQVAVGGEFQTTSLAFNTIGGGALGIQTASGESVGSPGLGAQYVAPKPSVALNALASVIEIPVNRLAGIQSKIPEGNDLQVSATAGASPPLTSSGSEEQSVAADVNGPLDLRCDYPGCEKTFTSADSHRKHRARHNLRFRCSMCDWKFGTRSDLERHESTVHSQGAARLWHCTDPSCRRRGKGFSRRDNFRKHMREVHSQNDAASDAPSSGQKRKRGDGDDVAGGGDGGGNGAGVQALERENQRLRDEVETLHREREAEGQRHRQAVAEGARELLACRETQAKLVGILDRVLSRDSS